METTYKELLNQLNTEVSELKWIDLDRGQIDDPQKNYQMDYPAVLISFGGINWKSIGQGVEHGNCELTFRIVISQYNDSNNHTPESVLNKALTELGIRKKVCKALHAFSGTNFNELQHVNTEQEPRDDGRLVFNETYSTLLVDNSAVASTEDVEDVTVVITVG